MNQIKAILWDIDGVIIPTKKYASDIAIESFNLSASKVKFFFDNIWSSCLINECRLEDCLNIMLEGSDFEKKELEYIDFWFKTESRIDYELLNFIQKPSLVCDIFSLRIFCPFRHPASAPIEETR